jgi:hypothetical protein
MQDNPIPVSGGQQVYGKKLTGLRFLGKAGPQAQKHAQQRHPAQPDPDFL